MAGKIRTPITQALEEGALTRRELKALMQRSNKPAFLRLLIWFFVLALTGSLIAMTMGTGWVWLAMFVHGVVLVHHFSLQHECCHFTVFCTRWLNDLVGNICGFIIMLPHQHFRYEHCDHHTYTQLHGQDPELITLPVSVWKYLGYISSVPYWKNKFSELCIHISGRLRPGEEVFIPKEARSVVFWEARLMALAYRLLLASALPRGGGRRSGTGGCRSCWGNR